MSEHQRRQNEITILHLPTEILTAIWYLLDHPSGCSFSLTCARLNSLETRIRRNYKSISIKGAADAEWYLVETHARDGNISRIQFSSNYSGATDVKRSQGPREQDMKFTAGRLRGIRPREAATVHFIKLLSNSEVEDLVVGVSGIVQHICMVNLRITNLTIPICEHFHEIVESLKPAALNISFLEKATALKIDFEKMRLRSLTSYYVAIPISVESLLESGMECVRLLNQDPPFSNSQIRFLVEEWCNGRSTIDNFCLSANFVEGSDDFIGRLETNSQKYPLSFHPHLIAHPDNAFQIRNRFNQIAWFSYNSNIVSFSVV